MSKKGDILQHVEITEMAAEGKCLGRVENKVVFVGGVAPGDVADLRIIRSRSSYMEAVPVFFHRYSDKRSEPFCQHFGICGGCKWQHIPYETQLFYKHKQVKDALERIGKLPLPEINPILGSGLTRGYRNKMEFSFSNKRWLTEEEIQTGENFNRNGLGFHIPGQFDKVLDLHECYLHPDLPDRIRNEVRHFSFKHDYTFFDIREQTGLLRGLLIRTTSTGEVMVLIQFFENQQDKIETMMRHLKNGFPEITSLLYVINPKKNDTFQDLEVRVYHGKPYIEEKMEDLVFRIGPKSFYQTNSLQAYKLYKIARDFAKIKPSDVVYDLYTGTGTIANFVASKAAKVVGIEYVPAAVDDAKENARYNHIGNTVFYAGDMKDLLTNELVVQHGKPDVVITDPPRAGMHEDVVKMLLTIAPERIVYISCNPATQARDLQLLGEKYHVTAVQPVDMFPHTHHVENVVLLEKFQSALT